MIPSSRTITLAMSVLAFVCVQSQVASAQAAPAAKTPPARVAKKRSKQLIVPRDVKLPPSTKGLPDLWLATSDGWTGLSVESVSLHGALSGGSRATVDVTGTSAGSSLLGKEATVALRIPKGFRYYNGYITKAQQRPGGHLSLTIEPWIGLLRKTATVAVFENESLPGAMYRVMDRHPVASFRFELDRSYEKRGTIVQYRETDGNLVARLAEDIGLMTTIEHKRDSHQAVFSDSQRRRPNLTLRATATTGPNSLSSWTLSHELAASRYVLTNHHVDQEPSTATSTHKSRAYLSGMEVFDYEPNTASDATLRKNAVIRLEEHRARTVVASGATEDPRLRVGDVIKLVGHATDNGNYLVIDAMSQYYTSSGTMTSHTSFSAIPASTTFRPQRRTAWPTIGGIQQAQVISTDTARNRLRIRFSWDRSKSAATKGSAWVSLPDQLKGTLPKKGQWISIGFFEGEPSLPMMLGPFPAASRP